MTFSDFLPYLLPGETLVGKYRIERVLGQGAMGMVLGARNLALNQRVAIKILNRELTPDIAQRFIAEGRAAAGLPSDHIARVFDHGLTPAGHPYLVMEHLEGDDLAKVLKQGPVAPELAVTWVLGACEALAHAHRHGIVHRDLKPANLFLERRASGSRRIKLLDFGVAKLPTPLELTGTNQLLGSPGYMSPEQFSSSRDVDSRADIWGLGGVLYELLTGQRPFSGDTLFELAANVRENEHVSACDVRALPVGLSQIIDRCLAKDRDRRWPNVATLAQALAEFALPDGQRLADEIQALSTTPDPAATLDAPPTTPALAGTEAAAPALVGPSTSVGAHSDVLAERTRATQWPVLARWRASALGLVVVLGLALFWWRPRALLPSQGGAPHPTPAVAVPTPAANTSVESLGPSAARSAGQTTSPLRSVPDPPAASGAPAAPHAGTTDAPRPSVGTRSPPPAVGPPDKKRSVPPVLAPRTQAAATPWHAAPASSDPDTSLSPTPPPPGASASSASTGSPAAPIPVTPERSEPPPLIPGNKVGF